MDFTNSKHFLESEKATALQTAIEVTGCKNNITIKAAKLFEEISW